MTHLENQIIGEMSSNAYDLEKRLEEIQFESEDSIEAKVRIMDIIPDILNLRLRLELLHKQPITAAAYAYDLLISGRET